MNKNVEKNLEKSSSKIAQNIFYHLKALEDNGVNVINFAFSAPGFETPELIREAAFEALKMYRSTFTGFEGLPELKMELCDYIDRTRGFRPKLEQILICPNAKSMLFTILFTILNKGDEVLLIDPCIPSYSGFTELLGAKVKYLVRNEQKNFMLDLEHLKKVLGKKIKAIIINTPHNPTGKVMTNSELQELSEIAEKNKVLIISDETFSQIIFNGHHISPAIYDRAQNQTIIIENLSYTFSMNDWQLSFCVGPKKVIKTLQTVMIDTQPIIPSFIQYASIEALRNADKLMPEILDRYNKCGSAMVTGLNELPGFNCAMPEGTIYAFPDITGTKYNSIELAEYLLENVGVAVLPGSIFGPSGENHIRLSFATPNENINEGLTRLQESF